MTLKIYHIGLQGYGRLGFEHLVELVNHGPVEAELCGVCSHDPDELESAEKFARAHEIEIQTFQDVHEMYTDASEQDGRVFVYDTGSSDTHSDNLYRSLQHGFYHLAERPPSLSREEHLRERKLSENSDVTWKVDFIERENPVVRKAEELLEGTDVEAIRTYRFSSKAVEAALIPQRRRELRGGTVLKQAINEVYVMDFLDAAGVEPSLDIESAETNYYTPFREGSDKLLSIEGGYVEDLDEKAAEADLSARFSAGTVEVEINSGWLGLSNRAMARISELQEISGHDFRHRDFVEADGRAFVDERAAFFVIEGDRNLAGDLIEGKLFDLESGKEIETDYRIHTPLYRVIEDAARDAAGQGKKQLDVETDRFMDALFDAREQLDAGEYMEELKKANSRLESMVVEDTENQGKNLSVPS
ncbi:MAG: hypothetical protein ABEJ98_02780 [Candidatus Nanohaloarchaea archaeon]